MHWTDFGNIQNIQKRLNFIVVALKYCIIKYLNIFQKIKTCVKFKKTEFVTFPVITSTQQFSIKRYDRNISKNYLNFGNLVVFFEKLNI